MLFEDTEKCASYAVNNTGWPEHSNLVSITAQELLHAANVGRSLAPAFSEFVEATSQLPIAKLEYWEGVFRSEIDIAAQPRTRFRLKLLPSRPHRLLIPWLDCCSSNGHHRERALRKLNEGAPNCFLLAFVLRRLNDWVPEVRAVARDRIPAIAKNTKSKHLLEALWGILPYLHTWGRLQADDVAVLVNLLGTDDIPLQLTAKLIAMTAGPAPSILAQMGRQPAFDSFLPHVSEAAIQPAVRAKAYKSQLDGYTTWIESYQWVWTDKRWGKGRYRPVINKRKVSINGSFLEILMAAAKDKSPFVRKVAGNALFMDLGDFREGTVPIAKILSKDVSPSVAERGRFALKRLKV